MLVEDLHQLGEVGERAGEPIDLVDYDDIDPSRPEIGEQALQGGAVEGGAREPAIVVAVANEPPALVGLALDIGLAGFPLGVERVELEVEVMLGRLAGIDRAAEDLSFGCVHGCSVRAETLPPSRGELRATAASPETPA